MKNKTLLWIALAGIGYALYLKQKSESDIPVLPPVAPPTDTPVSNNQYATY